MAKVDIASDLQLAPTAWAEIETGGSDILSFVSFVSFFNLPKHVLQGQLRKCRWHRSGVQNVAGKNDT